MKIDVERVKELAELGGYRELDVDSVARRVDSDMYRFSGLAGAFDMDSEGYDPEGYARMKKKREKIVLVPSSLSDEPRSDFVITPIDVSNADVDNIFTAYTDFGDDTQGIIDIWRSPDGDKPKMSYVYDSPAILMRCMGGSGLYAAHEDNQRCMGLPIAMNHEDRDLSTLVSAFNAREYVKQGLSYNNTQTIFSWGSLPIVGLTAFLTESAWATSLTGLAAITAYALARKGFEDLPRTGRAAFRRFKTDAITDTF